MRAPLAAPQQTMQSSRKKAAPTAHRDFRSASTVTNAPLQAPPAFSARITGDGIATAVRHAIGGAPQRGPAAVWAHAGRATARDLPGPPRSHREAGVGRAHVARERTALRSARRSPSRRRPPRGVAARAPRGTGGDDLHRPRALLPAALRGTSRLGRGADRWSARLGGGGHRDRASVSARSAAAAARGKGRDGARRA